MRFHRSTVAAAAVSGILTLVLVGTVAFAFVSIRSTPESPGAEPAAYVIVGVAVLLAALLAAAMGGAAAAGARALARHLRGRRA